MKNPPLKEQTIMLVLKSEILKTRQKWRLVRQIKKDVFTPPRLEEIKKFFTNEKAFFQNKKNTPETYLQTLKDWNGQLKAIIQKRRRQKLHQQENSQRETENLDNILQELNQI